MSAGVGNFLPAICLVWRSGDLIQLTYSSVKMLLMQTHENQIADWSGTKPAWANVWHLWTVFIPRRTITGRLVCGKVWRRHDGRRWIYKRFVRLDDPDA
jgi:hypothetical protein